MTKTLLVGEFLVASFLVWGQIEAQNAVSARSRGVLVKRFEAVGVDRIEVGEEDNGGVHAVCSDLADEFDDFRGRGTGLESALGCHLIHDAVRKWIGEGDAEFDQVGAGISQTLDHRFAMLHVQIASGDIGDESLLALGLKAAELGINTVLHETVDVG